MVLVISHVSIHRVVKRKITQESDVVSEALDSCKEKVLGVNCEHQLRVIYGVT